MMMEVYLPATAHFYEENLSQRLFSQECFQEKLEDFREAFSLSRQEPYKDPSVKLDGQSSALLVAGCPLKKTIRGELGGQQKAGQVQPLR